MRSVRKAGARCHRGHRGRGSKAVSVATARTTVTTGVFAFIVLRSVAACFSPFVCFFVDNARFAALASRQAGRTRQYSERTFGPIATGIKHSVRDSCGLRCANVARVSPSRSLQTRTLADHVRDRGVTDIFMVGVGSNIERSELADTTIDPRVHIVFDGLQQLRNAGPAEMFDISGKSHETLANAVLGALHDAHDQFALATRDSAWQLFLENPVLLRVPMKEVRGGNVSENQWASVTKEDDTLLRS
eukprot:TRINITY_DN43823_c0_g1_i1.p1 TRINITY_DN43823_c0_g1~~TRINITY_DN43823_c0_g1_i1.p1  ORF type:complete len:264 (+),score=30.60 TRINITY_DN43823_c0_g1_i1:55-792(+)